jgi:SagB-type dehydrogenase family enzyme
MWDPSEFLIEVRTSDKQGLASSQDVALLDEPTRRLLSELTSRSPDLLRKPADLRSLEAAASEAPEGRLLLHALLAVLANRRLISVSSRNREVTFIPYDAPTFHALYVPPGNRASVRLSRFMLLRPHEQDDAGLVLECPRAHAHLEIKNAAVAAAAAGLLASRRLGPIVAADSAMSLLAAGLYVGGFVSEAPGDKNLDELPYWEFHDLYFHSRTRLGRHQNRIGGTFRMAEREPLPPAVKKITPALARIPLPRPDPALVAMRDMSLTAVMETRQSVRQHAAAPLTLGELGEFLHRSCAVRASWTSPLGEFTRRPYPSGGGSYDIEIYLIVNRVQGLAAGVYHYDPVDHCLLQVREDNETARAMLVDAYYASAQTCYPDILLILASRYKRVSWKYSGMAYATILKNVGALYATLYLVATAMRLAPCGLGLGDPEKFAKLTGIDYYDEGSVGEFMLGRA